MNSDQKKYKILSSAFDISRFVQDSSDATLKRYLDYTRLSQTARQDLLLNAGVLNVFFKDDVTNIIKSLDNNNLIGLYRKVYINVESHDLLPLLHSELDCRELSYTQLSRIILVKARVWDKVPPLRLLEFRAVDLLFISSTVSVTNMYREIVLLCNRDITLGKAALYEFIGKIDMTVRKTGRSRISSVFRSYSIIMKSHLTGIHIDLCLMQIFSEAYTPKAAISLIAKSIDHIETYPNGSAIFGDRLTKLTQHGLTLSAPSISVAEDALDWAIKEHTMTVLSGKADAINGRLSKNVDIIKRHLK